MANKERLALRISPETRQKIECWQDATDCRSMNAFVEQAVNFYADYLALDSSNTLLPTSIQTAIDGRLRVFEDRMASLLFKQSVELDMGMRILADCINLDEEYLRRRRASSIANVKRTNGRLRFEQIFKYSQAEHEDGYGDA